MSGQFPRGEGNYAPAVPHASLPSPARTSVDQAAPGGLIPFSVFRFLVSVEQPPRLLYSEDLPVGRALPAIITASKSSKFKVQGSKQRRVRTAHHHGRPEKLLGGPGILPVRCTG